MILSARFLTNVSSVNAFGHAPYIMFTEGDPVDVHVQLVDTAIPDLSPDLNGFSGRRYVPASGATLVATVDNIDNNKQIMRPCTQPFANDGSIWRFQILATDKLRGTANLKLVLLEGGVTRRALVQNAIRVQLNSNI